MASESGGMKSTFLAKVSSDLPNRLFLPIARKIGKLHQEFVRSSFLFTPKVLEALRSGVIVTRWRRVGMKGQENFHSCAFFSGLTVLPASSMSRRNRLSASLRDIGNLARFDPVLVCS
jgi:hypothetical protein